VHLALVYLNVLLSFLPFFSTVQKELLLTMMYVFCRLMSQLADANIQSNIGMFTFVIFYLLPIFFLQWRTDHVWSAIQAVLWYCTLLPPGKKKQSVAILLIIELLLFMFLLILNSRCFAIFALFVKPVCETGMLHIYNYE